FFVYHSFFTLVYNFTNLQKTKHKHLIIFNLYHSLLNPAYLINEKNLLKKNDFQTVTANRN
ncbi:MAG TPA: hypothetical protein DCQ58_11415, partial [Saprospirales bacterium]|nr:hypothetical protein [Saprospirales bacterium]